MGRSRVVEDPVAVTVRTRLRWLREGRGQSLDDVAKGTGLARSAVQRQESGAGRIDVTALMRYVRHYGAPAGWLLGYEGCSVCEGKPPANFTCQACGATGERA